MLAILCLCLAQELAAVEVRLAVDSGPPLHGSVSLVDLGLAGKEALEILPGDPWHWRGRDGEWQEFSPPAPTLVLNHGSSLRVFPWEAVRELVIPRPASVVSGQLRFGIDPNGLRYSLRQPQHGPCDRALLLLHGSNMNAEAYLRTVVQVWPELAERFVLVAVNGEQPGNSRSHLEPAYNYTYVNFMGRSRYRGYPGSERESPALVAELIASLRERLALRQVLVSGHSQGAFLSFCLLMHFPEIFDGAAPLAGGLLVQCEPSAFDLPSLEKLQRAKPLVIVHGENDSIVDFVMAEAAFESFEAAGFPWVRLMAAGGGHSFMHLPFEEAISWLEWMLDGDRLQLESFAQKQWRRGETRLVDQALARLEKEGRLSGPIAELKQELERTAAEDFAELRIASGQHPDRPWVDLYLDCRESFPHLIQTTEYPEIYSHLQNQHQILADHWFQEYRRLTQLQETVEARIQLSYIVDQAYASTWYRMAKRWLKEE
ncbi:MAG: hypothetical protein DWQ01_09625 [Planctomycetota bacterium]|nr:MAG: hypothetical protein DWQ01_09625 [Planctomycetota bacterium]